MRDLEMAMKQLKESDYSLIAVKNGVLLCQKKGRGIAPLWEAINELHEEIPGSCIADRVIGKAAALLCVYGNVKGLYSPVISNNAVKVLENNKIEYKTEQIAPYILNRRLTGLCPMEELTLDIDSPEKAVHIVSDFVIKMKDKGAS